MRRHVLALIVLVVVMRSCTCRCRDPEPGPQQRLRVATFNIENFPKSSRQIDGAFDEIVALDAPIVAVQEITDPELFRRVARERLGERWDFDSIGTGSVLDHEIGVLFDRARVRTVDIRVHDETKLDGGFKPVFEMVFDWQGGRVHVLVVHLKAGGENHPVRRRQYAALARILAKVRARSAAPIVLLGDFNATGDADREDLARVDLRWLTQGLSCSAFWDRDDGCPRSRLDHVLSTEQAVSVRATGGCAADGCAWQDRCPLYAAEVSDHCPVVVDLDR